MTRGESSPANPARVIDDPMSMTTAPIPVPNVACAIPSVLAGRRRPGLPLESLCFAAIEQL